MSDKQRANYMAEKNSKKKKGQETEAQPEQLSSKILVCNLFAIASKMMQCTASSFVHSNKALPMYRCCPPIKKLIRTRTHRKAIARVM